MSNHKKARGDVAERLGAEAFIHGDEYPDGWFEVGHGQITIDRTVSRDTVIQWLEDGRDATASLPPATVGIYQCSCEDCSAVAVCVVASQNDILETVKELRSRMPAAQIRRVTFYDGEPVTNEPTVDLAA